MRFSYVRKRRPKGLNVYRNIGRRLFTGAVKKFYCTIFGRKNLLNYPQMLTPETDQGKQL